MFVVKQYTHAYSNYVSTISAREDEDKIQRPHLMHNMYSQV